MQGVWGTEVPSGIQEQSPGKGSGGQSPPEAEAILYFYGQILTNLTVYFSALMY